MCDECHTSPHLEGCPNEPEPQVFVYCDSCGNAIRIGDEYVDLDPDFYCMYCATVKTAEVEEE